MPTGVYQHKPSQGFQKGVKKPPFSEKTRKKMREARKRFFNNGGKPPMGMLGKKQSKEWIEKIKKINTGNKYRLGTKLSEETKRKMSLSHKGLNTWSKGRKLSAEHIRNRTIAQSGEKSIFWKGGITPLNSKIRNSIEFRLWRESVFARDNWTCQECEIKGGELHPHHIQNFAEYLELRFAIDNGITFCGDCHRKFHKKYGIKNNTKEQIDEFLNYGR